MDDAITLLTGVEKCTEDEFKEFLQAVTNDHLKRVERIMDDVISKRESQLRETHEKANKKRRESKSFKQKCEAKVANIADGKNITRAIKEELERRASKAPSADRRAA